MATAAAAAEALAAASAGSEPHRDQRGERGGRQFGTHEHRSRLRLSLATRRYTCNSSRSK